MKHNIIILLSLFLVVFSCDKEDPYIKIEQTNLHLSSVGGLRTISFVSNKGWTANSSAQWCRVSNASGDASMSSSIEVAVDANDTYEKRSCTVTITVGGVSNVATITQDAKTGIIVSKARYELLNNAETIVVEVKSNIHFDVNISKEAQKWITQVDTRGLSETTLMFDIAKNESYGNREGTITFSESFGDLKDVIQVFQSQEDAIILSKNRYNLTENAHKLDVEVKSNVDYKVIIPKEAQSWVSYVETRALRSETVVLAVAKNVDYNARSSEIYIKNIATNLQDTLTVNQAANRGLIVSEDEYYLSDKEGVVEIEVMANVKFNIEISDNAQDWISEIETRGLTETKLQFSVAKNNSYSRRDGTITISEKDGSLSTTIKVYQSQKDAIIISKKLVEVSKEAQQIDVDLKTNVSNFDIVIPKEFSEWVSYVETRALRNETIVLNIAENSDYDTRSAKVYIKDRATNLQDTLTIIQDANTALVLDQDEFILSDKETVIEVEVLTNVKFDVAISDDWISEVKTRGLSESKLKFIISKNSNYNSREGTITISEKDGGLSSIIKVYQSQKDAIILSEKVIEISKEAQTVEAKLKTNVSNFDVVIPKEFSEWISYVETRALRNETIVLNIAQNSSYDVRSAKVYVKDRATNLQDTLTIIQDPQKGLIVSPDDDKDRYLPSEGGTFNLEVQANIEFEVEISADWIKQVKTRGLAKTDLQFSIAKNTTYSHREGTIIIREKGGDLSSVINVYQSQKDAIIISNKVEDVTHESQRLEVKLEVNIEDFEVVIPKAAQGWLSYIKTRGLRSESFTLNISENETYSVRSTEVYVKNTVNNLQDTLTINQKPDFVFFLSDNEFELTKDGGSIELEVNSNFDADVEVLIPESAQNWVSFIETRVLGKEKLTLNIAENKGFDRRTAKVVVKDKKTKLQGVATIMQAPNSGLIVSVDEYEVSGDGGTIEVEVNANIEYDIEVSEDSKGWINQIRTRGLTASKIKFDIAKNDTYSNREGIITVKQRGGKLSSTIKVHQSQNHAIIISKKVVDISYLSQQVELELKTNVENFDVIIPNDAQQWISYIKTRVLGNKTVVLEITKNEAYSTRSAEVYIKDKSSDLQEMVTINQGENFDFDYDLGLLCDGEWRATLVRGNKRWDLTTPVNELYNVPTYLKFDMDGSLTSEGAFGKGVGRYTTQGKVINTIVGKNNESFEVTYLDANTAKIMVNASLFHLPQITSYWEVVEVTLTKNYGRKIDFDYGIENLYGRWRATSIDRAINNKGEDVFDRSVNLTTPDMESEIAPSYITFEAGGGLFIEGIFGEGGGKYTTRGVTFYILTDENELSEVEVTALDGNIAKVRVDMDKVGFNFGKYQGTLDSWKVKIVTLTLTKQADK